MKLGHVQLAAETIDFQTDQFPAKLEELINEAYDCIKENPSISRKELNKSSIPGRINKLIFDRTGIRVSVTFNTETIGCVMVCPLNNQHILVHPSFRDWFNNREAEKALENAKTKRGSVDLKNAKVSGIFSEYIHEMHIDIIGGKKTYNLDAKEIVAIILHELGHAFSWYEYSDRLSSTNQVLAEIASNLTGRNTSKSLEYLYQDLAKSMNKEKDYFSDLEKEDKRIVIGTKIFKEYIKYSNSLNNNKEYNHTSSEQLADSFAARFNLGRYLVTGLHKIHQVSGDIEAFGYPGFLMYLYSTIIFVITPAIAIIACFITNAALMGGFYLSLYLLMFFISGDSNKDYTYDNLYIRYKRIREQLIYRIKANKNISKELAHTVVYDIERIDACLKQVKLLPNLFNWVANFFGRSSEVNDLINEERLLEELTNSDLFIKYAKIQSL